MFWFTWSFSIFWQKSDSRKIHLSYKTVLQVKWVKNKENQFIWNEGRKAGLQERLPLFLEDKERYISSLDGITGHYLFGTTESSINFQVNVNHHSPDSGLKKFLSLPHSYICFFSKMQKKAPLFIGSNTFPSKISFVSCNDYLLSLT